MFANYKLPYWLKIKETGKALNKQVENIPHRCGNEPDLEMELNCHQNFLIVDDKEFIALITQYILR